jgi:cobalamin biosynthetic protein CobC
MVLKYQRPAEQWLDLSTGIAPFSYPIPDIPQKFWQNLPNVNDALIQAAKNYYRAKHCLACAGSQAVIEKLPHFWRQKHQQVSQVYLPKVGYKEHQESWLSAGFTGLFYRDELPLNIEKHAVVVVINPNNPSTQLYSKPELLSLYQRVKSAQGLLIIDEAFIDVTDSARSLVEAINDDHLIVLRSFGKFFGLAGIRIGFVCASASWIKVMNESFGPWQVNGPAQYIAQQALQDTDWQHQQREKLKKQSLKLAVLLQQYFVAELAVCPLFITVYVENAPEIHQQLCQHGVYVRLTDEMHSLRFGIASDEQLVKLKAILKELA